MSKQVKPDQVMAYLNELFTAFDELVDTYQIYKVRERACTSVLVQLHVSGEHAQDSQQRHSQVIHNLDCLLGWSQLRARVCQPV